MKILLKTERGIGLLQVLVGLGITSVVMLAFTSMMSIQSRETAALSQKLEILAFEKNAITVADIGCTLEVSTNNYEINESALTASPPPTIQFTRLYMGNDNTTPVLAQVDQPLTNSSPFKTQQIQLRDIRKIRAGLYASNLVFTFNGENVVRAIKPTAIPMHLSTVDTSNPDVKKIIACTKVDQVTGPRIATLYSQYPQGTSGGVMTHSTWAKRDINTIGANPSNIVTLSSGQFTLPGGDYLIEAEQIFWAEGNYQTTFVGRIHNTTDDSTAIHGLNCRSHVVAGNSIMAACPVKGFVSLSGSKTFELQYHAQSPGTPHNRGLGIPQCIPWEFPCVYAPTARPEVYASIIITKLK